MRKFLIVFLGVIFVGLVGCNRDRERSNPMTSGLDKLTTGIENEPSISNVSYTFSGQGTFNWPGYPVENVSLNGTAVVRSTPVVSFQSGGFNFYNEAVVDLTAQLSNGLTYTKTFICSQPPTSVKSDNSDLNFQQAGSTQGNPNVNMSMHFLNPNGLLTNAFENLDRYQTITFNMWPDQALEDVVYRGTINRIQKGM